MKEDKFCYSDKKYCERLGREVTIEQIKASGSMISQCGIYFSFGMCLMDVYNPINCPFTLEKLAEK